MSDCSAKRRALAIAVGLGCITIAGCGGVYDSTVTGVVTLENTVVTRGTVTFSPQGPGPTAFGQIQSDGRYQLRTGREEGLPPGQYSVTVVANEPPASARSADGGPAALGKAITPLWYSDPANSGLSFAVTDGDNVIDLQLTNTPPAGWKPPPGRR